MRSLRTGEDHIHGMWRSGRRRKVYLDTLVSQELHAGAPVNSSTPVLPEDRPLSDHERMQQHTDLARLRGSIALPLTLLAQGAGPTITNAGSIHHAQAAISFATPLMGGECVFH